jgi:mRNA interferase MazF
MKQADIYLADLNPVIGSEQAGKRPVVIISGDTMNTYLKVCIICPISSKMKNYASCTIISASKKNGLQSDSEVITFQLRTISQKRLIKKIGTISASELQTIFQGLNDILKY